MAIPRILVVDDDSDVRQMLTQYLRRNGAIALPAASGAEVDAHLAEGRVDCILLDVMLGDEDGLQICARLRAEQDVPIIMVSALSADAQRMRGYEVGADDYIAKPFNPDLLLARIKAVLARARRASSLVHRRATRTYRFAGWTYDAKRDEVLSPSDVLVTLSRRETALLRTLLANPRIPLTREEIAVTLDGDGGGQGAEQQGRAIDVLVGRLRAKIEVNPRDPQILRTERGVGYVFATDVTVSEA
ncbi:response regulator transcription factor [Sulfitobacter albidus]|uniref:Response regulator transcription factor n=1 Tax=Sulfitobacter albidus TaxID=2829501 RepID=A0A975PM60_9RHOB|nr:response regulator transcription factor [Sulfitobacter albidus]QUJ76384.1 response regulator transcription factor [Sulfitobacter albidus]